jgi:hypothetical protein
MLYGFPFRRPKVALVILSAAKDLRKVEKDAVEDVGPEWLAFGVVTRPAS